MAFNLLINREQLELQPQTTSIFPGADGQLRGRVISENENREVAARNVGAFDDVGTVSQSGVLILSDDRTVVSSSVYNFVNLLSVITVNLVTIYDNTSQTFSIPSHSHKPVILLPSQVRSFSFNVTTQEGTSTNNNYYTGGFSIENVSPFSDNSFTITYSGARNSFMRDYLSGLSSTNVVIGDLPNDYTDVDGNSNQPAEFIDTSYSFEFDEDIAGSFFVQAIGDVPLTYSISGTLPSGISFNTSTGEISGTTSAVGTTNHTATATNPLGTDSVPVSIVVRPDMTPPMFLVNAYSLLIEPNDTVSFTPSVTGAEPITYSYTGTLPTGLSFNISTGEISGSVAAAVTEGLMITATNAYGSDTVPLTIDVYSPPTLTYPAVPSGATTSAGGTVAEINGGLYEYTSGLSVPQIRNETTSLLHVTVDSGDLDVTTGEIRTASSGNIEVAVHDGSLNVFDDIRAASSGSLLVVVIGNIIVGAEIRSASSGSIDVTAGRNLDCVTLAAASTGSVSARVYGDTLISNQVRCTNTQTSLVGDGAISVSGQVRAASSNGTITITGGGNVTLSSDIRCAGNNNVVNVTAAGTITVAGGVTFSSGTTGNTITLTSTGASVIVSGVDEGSTFTASN